MTPELLETLNKFDWKNTNQRHIIDLLEVVLTENGDKGLQGVLEVGLGY